MAASDAKKWKIGTELVEWLFLGVRTGARRSVEVYQNEKLTNRPVAIAHLTRAVNMPRRARNRINKMIADYDAINGAGSAQIFYSECLSLAGTVTLSDINSDLTAMEAQAQTIIDGNTSGDTLDQVATALESALTWEAKEWVFQLPEDYEDIPLVDN